MTKMPMHPIYRSSVQCNYSLGPVKPSRDGTYGAKKKPLPKKIEKERWKRGEKRKEKEKENGEVMKNSRGGEHNGELLGSERARGGVARPGRPGEILYGSHTGATRECAARCNGGRTKNVTLVWEVTW